MKLEDLGWDEGWAAAHAAHGAGLLAARVVMARGPISTLHDGEHEHEAIISGKVRHAAPSQADLPVVGDWVAALSPERPGELCSIEAVLPRRTVFKRRAPGDVATAQTLAANIDTVVIVMGLDKDFNVRRLERYIALAHSSGAAPVVVLSKADLYPDAPIRLLDAEKTAPGVPVVSARLLEGVPVELAPYLTAGKTVALLGSSGVGKSTLLNRLLGGEVQKTAAVRRHDARGRHTTTHRQLFFIPGGGMVIDSPGLREIQLWDADGGLEAAFDDVEALAGDCRFRDCRHIDEPGCGVRIAVVEGRLPAERLASWHKLRRELAATDAAEDPLARQQRKQGSKVLSRLLRKRLKQKQE